MLCSGPLRRSQERSKHFVKILYNAYAKTAGNIANVRALKFQLEESDVAPSIFKLFQYPPDHNITVHGQEYEYIAEYKDRNEEGQEIGVAGPAHLYQGVKLWDSYSACIEKILTSRDFIMCLCRVQALSKETIRDLCRDVVLGSMFPVRTSLEFNYIFQSFEDVPEFHLFSEFAEDFNEAGIRLFESISSPCLASWVLDDPGYFETSPWKLCLDPESKNSTFINTSRVKDIANLWYTHKAIKPESKWGKGEETSDTLYQVSYAKGY